MEEKVLLKLALIGSLLGILLLLSLSMVLEVREKSITQSKTNINKEVKVIGVVSNVNQKGSTLLFDIAQLEELNVVAFQTNLTLNKGDYLEVTGRIDEYNQKPQLVADKIVLK
jgi:DNA/RNA endonuclease YhcR with UshA esterase domain